MLIWYIFVREFLGASAQQNMTEIQETTTGILLNLVSSPSSSPRDTEQRGDRGDEHAGLCLHSTSSCAVPWTDDDCVPQMINSWLSWQLQQVFLFTKGHACPMTVSSDVVCAQHTLFFLFETFLFLTGRGIGDGCGVLSRLWPTSTDGMIILSASAGRFSFSGSLAHVVGASLSVGRLLLVPGAGFPSCSTFECGWSLFVAGSTYGRTSMTFFIIN